MSEQMSDSEKKKEDWMNSKWRPMMGWMYMGVCMFDFVLAPVMWSLLQSLSHGAIGTQWQPLTLQGAGLFHIAMGAVLGIAAMGRTQEKLAGANNGGVSPTPSISPTPSPAPAGGFGGFPSTPTPSAFSAPKPMPLAAAPTAAPAFGLDPSDPPVRNTRND
jgi:hypothetical protein